MEKCGWCGQDTNAKITIVIVSDKFEGGRLDVGSCTICADLYCNGDFAELLARVAKYRSGKKVRNDYSTKIGKKVHYSYVLDGRQVVFCNSKLNPTGVRVTNNWDLVTCRNCIQALDTERKH